MTKAGQKRLLQIAVAVAICVPILAGGAGVLLGPAFSGGTGAAAHDSHYRYLSGLLLGIGLAFATTLPSIETHRATFRLLTAIVFIGGLARLYGAIVGGLPPAPMIFGLAMELGVTPALCLWQNAVARRFAGAR